MKTFKQLVEELNMLEESDDLFDKFEKFAGQSIPGPGRYVIKGYPVDIDDSDGSYIDMELVDSEAAAKLLKMLRDARFKAFRGAGRFGITIEEELNTLEETELDELNMSTLQSYTKKALDDKNYNKRKNRPSNVTKALLKVSDKLNKFDQDKKVEEEAELNEISKATLAGYAKAALGSAEKKSAFASHLRNPDKDPRVVDRLATELEYKARKRRQGFEKAIDKLAKEEAELNEISKATLARYAKAAPGSLSQISDRAKSAFDVANNAQKDDDLEQTMKNISKAGRLAYKAHNRRQGHEKALDKLAKEEHSLSAADLMDTYVNAINNQDDFSDVLRQEAELNEISKAAFDRLTTKLVDKERKRKQGVIKTVDKLANKLAKEEAELNEISKATLARYAKAAPDSAEKLDKVAKTLSDIGHDAQKDGDYERSKQFHSKAGELMYKAYGRRRGHEKAIDKLAKEEAELNEISKEKLARYAKAAPDSADKSRRSAEMYADMGYDAEKKEGDRPRANKHYATADKLFDKARKRKQGYEKAIDKLTKD